MRLLEILDAFDKHSFYTSQWKSTVAVLYDKIKAIDNVCICVCVCVRVRAWYACMCLVCVGVCVTCM